MQLQGDCMTFLAYLCFDFLCLKVRFEHDLSTTIFVEL